MKNVGKFLIAFVFLACHPGAFAEDDFDAEVEESMAETDATTVQAKWARERQIKEANEAARLKREGEASKAVTISKLKQAEKELADAERETKRLQAEQAQHKKEKAANDKAVAAADKKLKTQIAKVDKLKGENEALRKLREEQTAKLADLALKTKDAETATVKLKEQVEVSKAEFQKSKADEKSAQERLKIAESERAKKQIAVQAEVERLRAQHMENKRKTEVIEADIRAKRQGLSKMEEEVKIAEAEVKAGEARMKDSEDRLTGMREKADQREAELTARKGAVEQTIESRAAQEAIQKIKQAEVDQRLQRAPADSGAGSGNMQVSLHGGGAQLASSRMTLSKDCRVYERPDGKSKVLGVKRAGSALSGQTGTNWVAFKTKDARTLYMPKGCF